LKGASLRLVPALPANVRLDWKGLPWTKTSILRKSVNYGQKRFYNIGPRLVHFEAQKNIFYALKTTSLE